MMTPRIKMIEVQYAKGRNAFKGIFHIQDFEGEEKARINALMDDMLNAWFIDWDANPEEYCLADLVTYFEALDFDDVVALVGDRVYRRRFGIFRNHENRYFVSFDEYQEKLT